MTGWKQVQWWYTSSLTKCQQYINLQQLYTTDHYCQTCLNGHDLLSELHQIYPNHTTVERSTEREAVASPADNQNRSLTVDNFTGMIVQHDGAGWALGLQAE
jgi:hypothetical protein